MNLGEIEKNLNKQFVNDYDDLIVFMDNINDTLEKLNIDNKYNYNDFCLDIKTTVIDLIKNDKTKNITPTILSKALNTMIKYKIIDDPNYEEKLSSYFSQTDDIIDEINDLKIKLERKDDKN